MPSAGRGGLAGLARLEHAEGSRRSRRGRRVGKVPWSTQEEMIPPAPCRISCCQASAAPRRGFFDQVRDGADRSCRRRGSRRRVLASSSNLVDPCRSRPACARHSAVSLNSARWPSSLQTQVTLLRSNRAVFRGCRMPRHPDAGGLRVGADADAASPRSSSARRERPAPATQRSA